MLVIDIDHFKSINDSHGHAAGDEVLREFARRVQKAVRGIDVACRLGGEEFVVAMPDTDAPLALLVGERLRQKIAAERFRVPERGEPIDGHDFDRHFLAFRQRRHRHGAAQAGGRSPLPGQARRGATAWSRPRPDTFRLQKRRRVARLGLILY